MSTSAGKRDVGSNRVNHTEIAKKSRFSHKVLVQMIEAWHELTDWGMFFEFAWAEELQCT